MNIRFGFSCVKNCSYYLMDYYSALKEYDQNWNLVKTISISQASSLITLNDRNGKTIYVTTSNGVYRLNSNFNVLNLFLCNWNQFFGLTYNSATDQIIVSSNANGLLIFDRNLTLIRTYNSIGLFTTDIEKFNDHFYVSTYNGMIWVLNSNVTINHSFQTICNYIKSISIDNYGYIAILCNTFTVYVYSINGAFMNIAWTSTTLLPFDMSFDANGAFFLTGPNGIYYLGLNGVNLTKYTGASLDTSCIVASTLKHFMLLINK